MLLLEKINSDFKEAYLKKEMDKKNYLGFLKSEVTKETKTPDDAYIIGKFKAMLKNGEQSNSLNVLELQTLNSYIPKQMDKEKLTNVISTFLSENGISGKQNMGKVMGYLKKEYSGEYDGRMASELSREML